MQRIHPGILTMVMDQKIMKSYLSAFDLVMLCTCLQIKMIFTSRCKRTLVTWSHLYFFSPSCSAFMSMIQCAGPLREHREHREQREHRVRIAGRGLRRGEGTKDKMTVLALDTNSAYRPKP